MWESIGHGAWRRDWRDGEMKELSANLWQRLSRLPSQGNWPIGTTKNTKDTKVCLFIK